MSLVIRCKKMQHVSRVVDSLQYELTFQQVPNVEETMKERQKYAVGDLTLTSKEPQIANNLNALL